MMKKFTGNFIAIMFAGVFIMTMLVNDFFAAENVLSVQAAEQTSDADNTVISVEMLSPDEIDVNRPFSEERMGGSGYSDRQQLPTTFPSDDEKEVTTVTTGLTTTTSKITTTTVPQKENDVSNIKNPNYKSKYYIVVYTGSQSVVVYGKDSTGAYSKIIKKFTCSTGNKKSSPTRKGVYAVRTKYKWKELMGGVYGQYSCGISPDYLFHSVPYAAKDPSTLYDASYNNLGRAVSHGCIRLCVRDAKWIYDNVPIGTQVNVVWTSGPAGMGVPKRKSGAKYSGWDPSDEWSEGNPYFDGSETKTTTKKTTSTSVTTASSTVSTSTSASETTKTTKTTKTTEATTHSTASSTHASSTTTAAETTTTTQSQSSAPSTSKTGWFDR